MTESAPSSLGGLVEGGTELAGLLLPPDSRSAAAARRHLRTVLQDAGLDQVLDEALLVVSELVTNAVVHAGTEVELHVRAEPGGLWLQVVDHLPGVVPLMRAADGDREGGRGVFLLDALASEWGTAHRPDSKAVWCRLALPGPTGQRPARAAGLTRPGQGPEPLDLGWVLDLPADLERRLPLRLVLRELLHRLCDALQVDDGAALAVLDVGADAEPVSLRGRGLDPDQQTAALRAAQRDVRAVDADGLLVLPLTARLGSVGALVLRFLVPPTSAQRAVGRVVADRVALLVADSLQEQQRQADRGALALLAEASELFAESLDVRLAASLTTQLVVPRFGTSAALLTGQERGLRLDSLTCQDEEQTAGLREALSGPAGRALTASLLVRLAGGRPVPVEDGTALAPYATHVLALPLVARRRLLGLLLVGSDGRGGATATTLLLDLARRAALALDNARLFEQSSAVARVLQESLLPSRLPEASGLTFGARYAAAGDSQVGGDFYDVFPLPGGGFGLAVGDVCGKGPEAAAITGVARQVLRGSMQDGYGPAACFSRLNAVLLELGERGRFLTGAAAVVQVEADGVRVRLGNAGHPLPVLLGARAASFVGAAGDLVGVMPTVSVPETDVLLGPGESLVFYTDGVTERRDGDVQFGDASLLAVLRGQSGLDADRLARLLEDGVRSFSRSAPRDDLAVLVVRADPGPAGTPVLVQASRA